MRIKPILSAAVTVVSVLTGRADYPSTILSDAPLAYYRLNVQPPPIEWSTNYGTLGSPGNATHSAGITHLYPGPLAGTPDGAVFYNGNSQHSLVPHNSALNPSGAFTIEAWVYAATTVNDAVGPAPLFNRQSSGNRQGWVFFQRSPATGYNFRSYNENGSTPSVDITGGAYTPNTWIHLVVAYTGSSATLYVNGVQVATGPGTVAPNKAINFSVGSYADGANPFTGAVGQVALYPSSLSDTKVAVHYSNGTNANRSVSYSSLVLGDGAVEYLPLNEPGPNDDLARNSGSLGSLGNGFNVTGVVHPVPGALAGSTNAAASYSDLKGSGTPTLVQYRPELNTPVFTAEAWVKPTVPGQANAAAPLMNRVTDDGAGGRQGWVIFQRAASGQTPPDGNGSGFNLRLYKAGTSSAAIDITGGSYTVGQWTHLAATFDGTSARLYVNGVEVTKSSVNGTYAVNNRQPFAVGSYSEARGGPYQNPFIGSIDEVALYPTALSAATLLSHYQNGTNSARSTPYENLITSAGAVEYLRLNEPAIYPVTNLGTLGAAAIGSHRRTTLGVSGPRPPEFAGFESSNSAMQFDGANSYVTLGNPTNLNISGKISLEAWVKPAETASGNGIIIAHENESLTAGIQLRLTINGEYEMLSFDDQTIPHSALFPAPLEDLMGTNWVHLVGVYDGTRWILYRNGVEVASAVDSVGARRVNDADWAIGALGTGNLFFFTGGIDEAAIYNTALSPARVQGHYRAGVEVPKVLSLQIQRNSSSITLTWPGTLQKASSLTGPWTDVLDQTSPATLPVESGTRFYRSHF